MGMQIHGIRRVVLATVGVVALVTGGGAISEGIATYQINQQTDTFKKGFALMYKKNIIESGVNEVDADIMVSNLIKAGDELVDLTVAKEHNFIELPSVTATRRYANWIKGVAGVAILEAYKKGLSVTSALSRAINDTAAHSKNLVKGLRI